MDKTTASLLTGPGAPRVLSIPPTIGSVRLIREIGAGGMGVVWLGQDEMLGRQVAVKFLLGATPAPADPRFERFVEGARAAAEVVHPGLTAMHSAGLVDGYPYVVMEYIGGPTLAQVLGRAGLLEPSALEVVLGAVCEAVGALHAFGIVHRDIKPANILIDPSGRLALTDFGLTCHRAFGRGSEETTVCGTPEYMAPEMFAGEVSISTDVYAIGVLAFELACGDPPFRGSVSELRRLHATEEWSPDRLRDRGCTDGFIEALARATRKNPALRQRSALQLWEEARANQLCAQAPQAQGVLQRLARGADDREQPALEPGKSYSEVLSTAVERRKSAAAAEPVVFPPEAEPLPFPTFAADVSCIACGYRLDGCRVDGRCPECAMTASESLRPDRLIFADPRWLRSLSRGMRCLHWAAVCWAIAVLVPFAAMGLPAVPVALDAVEIGLFIPGMFLLTRQEAADACISRGRRWAARGAALLMPLSLGMLLTEGGSESIPTNPFFVLVRGLVRVYASPVLVPVILPACFYFRSLARRMHTPGLATKAIWLAVCTAMLGALWMGCLAWERLSPQTAARLGLPTIRLACAISLAVASAVMLALGASERRLVEQARRGSMPHAAAVRLPRQPQRSVAE